LTRGQNDGFEVDGLLESTAQYLFSGVITSSSSSSLATRAFPRVRMSGSVVAAGGGWVIGLGRESTPRRMGASGGRIARVGKSARLVARGSAGGRCAVSCRVAALGSWLISRADF